MRPLILGLTGQSGAGKTTACEYFASQQYSVINCDMVAREVTAKGSKCLVDIAAEFSNSILLPDNSLDRKELGRIVFGNRQKLDRLNSIIFPYIMARINERISEVTADLSSNNAKNVIVLDAPTLFESGADSLCDIIIAVVADTELRLCRIVERDGISRESALARIASQHDSDFFKTRCHFIIENSSTHEDFIQAISKADAFIKEKTNLLQSRG